jgi:tRNA-dihydrouridine synthase A
MQCYTNTHLRVLLRALSAKAVLWTEMEKSADLLRSDKACSARLAHTPEEHPLVLQLGGSDTEQMAQAARRAGSFAFDEVNINCGCPAIDSGGADYGASLMRDPALTRRLVESVAEASGLPTSVKCRLGVLERAARDGEPSAQDVSYERLRAWVEAVSGSGAASHVVVHARAAVLAGLSPVQNRCIPPLNPGWVLRLAREMPELRITLNGGLGDMQAVRHIAAASGASCGRLDGVMAGRWLLRRPLDLWEVDADAAVRDAPGRERVRLARSRAQALSSYCAHAESCLARGTASLSQVVPPLLLVAEQLLEDARSLAAGAAAGLAAGAVQGQGAAGALDEAELRQILGTLWECVPALAPESAGRRGSEALAAPGVHAGSADAAELAASARKLSKRLSKAMGTKVANKLLRNRAEQ